MPTAGASPEPAHDSDTLLPAGDQGEVAGSVWRRPALGGVWNVDANVVFDLSALWRESAHHPKLAHRSGQRPGKSLLGFTVQPPCGTGGETEAQEGKDLPRVLQLVRGQSQDSDLGRGALGLQPQLCSIPGSDCSLSGKGRHSTGGYEDSSRSELR